MYLVSSNSSIKYLNILIINTQNILQLDLNDIKTKLTIFKKLFFKFYLLFFIYLKNFVFVFLIFQLLLEIYIIKNTFIILIYLSER